MSDGVRPRVRIATVSGTLQLLTGLAGARGSARIPVSRALLNTLVADALAGRGTPVRSVEIRPRDGDRFDVEIAVTWPFVPSLHATFTVERQPVFPESPVLELCFELRGAVGAIASRLVKSFEHTLPPGVRLDGDRLLLDLAALAARSPAAPFLGYLRALELHTLEDRAVINVELAIPE